MSEEKFVVSMKVEQLHYITPGSTQESCAGCGSLVSVAPSSHRFIDEHPGIQILCVECALSRAEASNEQIEVIPLSSKQETEIQDYFKRN